MSDHKHTPGPWTITTWDSPHGHEIRIDAGEDRILFEFEDSDQEQLANTRLIAAAPEMLEALEDIADYDKAQSDEDNFLLEEIVRLAKSAIAKATGKEIA